VHDGLSLACNRGSRLVELHADSIVVHNLLDQCGGSVKFCFVESSTKIRSLLESD
jgi:hypothetical protein